MLEKVRHHGLALALWAVLVPALTAQLSISLPIQPQPIAGGFSLGARDDVWDRVPFPAATVTQGGVTYGLMGDATGDIDCPDMNLNQDMTVRFDETPTSVHGGTQQAITIGQHFTYKAMGDGESFDGIRLVYCQPTARLVDFTQGNWPIQDEEWGLTFHEMASPYTPDFEAWTAELPTCEVISNYYAYAAGYHDPNWMHGVLMRLDEDVDLSGTPLIVAIDRDGYGYGAQGPQVQTDYVGSHPGGNGLYAWLMTTDADNIYVVLDGELRTGDNLILIEKGTNEPLEPVDAPGGTVIYPTFSNGQCTPPPPSCSTSGTCTPGCSGSHTQGRTTCEDRHELLDGVVCADCGSEVSKEKCSEFKGGIVAKMAWTLFGGELSISASGEVSGKTCSTVTALPGYCAQGYFCYKVCKRTCIWEIEMQCDPWITYDQAYTRYCMIDGNTKSSTCQHTDCSGG